VRIECTRLKPAYRTGLAQCTRQRRVAPRNSTGRMHAEQRGRTVIGAGGKIDQLAQAKVAHAAVPPGNGFQVRRQPGNRWMGEERAEPNVARNQGAKLGGYPRCQQRVTAKRKEVVVRTN